MKGLDIIMGIIGLYFLMSSYLVFYKDIQLTILLGYTYKNVRQLTDRTVINKDLSRVLLINGIILVVVSITKCILDLIILEDILYITFMYFIIKLSIIVRHINKGKYNS